MPALIAYYSRADENYFGGTLRYIDKGNTQIAAEILQSLTGADMFRIEQLKRMVRTCHRRRIQQLISHKKAVQPNDCTAFISSKPDRK